MQIGKVSETVLKRSVLKQIKSGKEEKGAGIGEDCAFLTCRGMQSATFSVQSFCLNSSQRVFHAIVSAINNVAVGGTTPVGVLLSVLLPPDSEEQELKEIMKAADAVCTQYAIRIMGGHTEVTDGVTRPIITAVGVGTEQEKRPQAEKVKPGQDVVVSKWIGLEGTTLLARIYEEQLLGRYPAGLVDEAKAYDKYLSILPEAATAVRSGVCAMHDVRSGGIFGALWELAERTGVGLKIDLKKIPVKQETIEVCEFVDVNPYELLSGGMLLMITDQGEELVSALEHIGVHGAVIGKTTDNNDKIVINGEETRFLEPPRSDEIYRKL